MQRLLVISAYCEAFSCTPLVARAELDQDPEHLGLLLMDLRTYLAAKRDFDGAKDLITDLAHWDGSPYMTLLELNTFELREERLARAAQEREADG